MSAPDIEKFFGVSKVTEQAERDMTSRFSSLTRLGAAASAATLALFAASSVWANEILGQPAPGGMNLQGAASEIREHQIWFHNGLLWVITLISLFVLGLLVIVVVRFNKRANPTPARWSHNTPIEVAWTVVPVLILAGIAIFSFKLLFEESTMPKADLTVKVTGRQWNWDYEYPDLKIAAYTSTPLSEAEAKAKNVPYLLASSDPMVAPIGKVVRVQVVAEDVIHSFSVPAFGIKVDAMPGRMNQVWFKANKTGTFYGQCSQLCGINHSYMPIEVKVVSQAEFDTWVASKAPKAKPAVVATATPASPAVAPASAQ